MMTEAERRQRLRDIQSALASRQRALAEYDDTRNTTDTSLSRTELETQIAELRAEREALQEPGGLMIWDRVNAMWKVVSDLDLDIRERWRSDDHDRYRWRMVYVGWLSVLTLVLGYLYLRLAPLMELWR